MNKAQPTARFQLDNDKLSWLVRGALAGLFLVAAAFAATYYWDRYHPRPDPAPSNLSVVHLEAQIREDPGDLTARITIAATNFEQGEYALAQQQAEQVLSAAPETPAALLISGAASSELSDYDLAVDRLSQFVSLTQEDQGQPADPVLPVALYYLGKSYLALESPVQAIQALKGALSYERTEADTIYLLGQAYLENGQFAEAIEQFHAAVRYVPTFMEAYTGMEAAYTGQDMPAHAKYARGMQAYARGDYDLAVTDLQNCLREISDFLPARLGLGLAFEALGDLDAARREIKAVLQLEPSNLNAHYAEMRIQSAQESLIHGQNN